MQITPSVNLFRAVSSTPTPSGANAGGAAARPAPQGAQGVADPGRAALQALGDPAAVPTPQRVNPTTEVQATRPLPENGSEPPPRDLPRGSLLDVRV